MDMKWRKCERVQKKKKGNFLNGLENEMWKVGEKGYVAYKVVFVKEWCGSWKGRKMSAYLIC